MRCPVCSVENTAGPNCRRCKADLGLLHDLEAARDEALTAAQDALGRGAADAALTAALRADHLRRDAETCRLVAALCVALRRFPEARAWAARCQAAGG